MGRRSTLATFAVKIGVDAKEFDKGLRKIRKKLKTFDNRMRKVGKLIRSYIIPAVTAMTASLVMAGTAVSKVGADFEQSITTVAVISGAAGNELQMLTDKARELGASTAYTATEAADAMQQFARTGMSAQQIVRASEDALHLAGSVGATMDQSTALIAASMRQFNMTSAETTRIVDTYSTAMKTTLFDMRSLTEAMKYAGTVGRSLGWDIESTTAAVAMFRNLGLEGSMAGTNFRMAMLRIAKVTPQAKKVLDDLGLTLSDVNPELNSFEEIMKKVGNTSITTEQAMILFGTRAGANVRVIAKAMTQTGNEFDKVMDAMANKTGSTAAMYEAMIDTVSGQSKILMSAIEELALTLFDTYKGPLKRLIQSLIGLVQVMIAGVETSSDVLEHDLGKQLDSLSEWITKNRHEIAITFRQLLLRLGEVVKWMRIAMQLAYEFKEVMAVIFSVALVYAFAMAIQKVVRGLVALKGAMLAAGLAANTAVLAFGAIGVAIAAVTLSLSAYERKVLEIERRASASMAEKKEMWEAELEAINASRQAQRKKLDEIGGGMAAGQRLYQERFEGAQAAEESYFDSATQRAQKEIIYLEERAGVLKRQIKGAGIAVQEEEARKAAAEEAARQAELDQLQADQALQDLMDQMNRNQVLANMADKEANGNAEERARLQGEEQQRLEELAETYDLLISGLQSLHYELEMMDDVSGLRALGSKEIENLRKFTEMADTLATGGIFAQAGDMFLSRHRDYKAVLEELSLAHADMSIAMARNQGGTIEGAKELAEQQERLEAQVRRTKVIYWTSAIAGGLATAVKSTKKLYDYMMRFGRAAGDALQSVLKLVTGLSASDLSISNILDDIVGQEDDDGNSTFQAGGNAGKAANSVSGLFTNAKDFMLALVELLPEFFAAIAEEIPTLVDMLVVYLPIIADQFVKGVVDLLPVLMDGLVTVLPVLLEAVIDYLPKLMSAAEDFIVSLVSLVVEVLVPQLIAALPDLIDGFIQTMISMTDKLGPMIVNLISMILAELPSIINQLALGLGELLGHVLALIPDLIAGIVAALPDLLASIISLIPMLITGLVLALPTIVDALINALPSIYSGLIALIPNLIIALIENLVQMIPMIIRVLIEEFILNLPYLAVQLVAALLKVFWELWQNLVQSVKDAISGIFDFLGGGSGDSNRDSIWDQAKDAWNNAWSGGRAYSGITHVPAKMRVTVDPGEVIIPANRAAEAVSGGSGNPAMPFIPSQRGSNGGTVQVSLKLNEKVLDEAIVSGINSGKAPRLSRKLRRGSRSVKGYRRSKFNKWVA